MIEARALQRIRHSEIKAEKLVRDCERESAKKIESAEKECIKRIDDETASLKRKADAIVSKAVKIEIDDGLKKRDACRKDLLKLKKECSARKKIAVDHILNEIYGAGDA